MECSQLFLSFMSSCAHTTATAHCLFLHPLTRMHSAQKPLCLQNERVVRKSLVSAHLNSANRAIERESERGTKTEVKITCGAAKTNN